MLRFKLGALLGFAAGWLVASGRAAEMWQRIRSRADSDLSGVISGRVERPVFERAPEAGVSSGGTTAVNA